jgi:hypothetical protein
MSREDSDEERPRWRDADEDDDEPRDWEEVEDEKEHRGGILRGTAPVARLVFAVLLLAIVVITILALTGGLRRWFGD